MRRPKVILGLAMVMLAVVASWQTASAYIANAELQEDLRDLAAQVGMRIGLDAPASVEELRKTVVSKADRYDIALKPEQITVQIQGAGHTATIFLAADYTAEVRILFVSYEIHFRPSSAK